MSSTKKDDAIYIKYRTLCCIPEEISKEYSVKLKMEMTDELYQQVKQKIMRLPASEVEMKISQVNQLLQSVLDDKKLFFPNEKMQQMASNPVQSKEMKEIIKTERAKKEPNSGFYVREHVLGMNEESKKTESVKKQPNNDFFVRKNVLGEKETSGTKNNDYNTKILELMKWTYRTYSKNLKQDAASLQKARINFQIPDETKIYYIFDWTLLGSCKEGLAICSDGLHYRFDVSTFPDGIIKWEALSQYDIQLYGPGKIRLNAKWNRKDAVFYFIQNEDAVKFIEILHKMQNK